MKKDKTGVLCALAAALCFGALPALVKAAYAGGISVLALLSIRYLLASAILVPATYLRERNRLPSSRIIIKIMLVAGIFLALEAGLYFYSLTLLPSSLAALILFTYPLLVNIFGLFTGGRLTLGSGLSMLLCVCGLIALLGPDFSRLNLMGILCAFLAAVSYSVYLLLINRMIVGVSPTVTNAVVSLSNAVTMTVVALATGAFSMAFKPSAWVSIVLIVAISNIAGFQLFFKALKLLGPERTSMLNMSEPVFTVLIALLFLGERLKVVQVSGAAVVLLGLFAFEYFKTKHSFHSNKREMSVAKND